MKPVNSVLSRYGTTVCTTMSALALEHGAINLGQGFLDEEGPEAMRRVAAEAVLAGPTSGDPPMRGCPSCLEAVADRDRRFYGLALAWETEVCQRPAPPRRSPTLPGGGGGGERGCRGVGRIERGAFGGGLRRGGAERAARRSPTCRPLCGGAARVRSSGSAWTAATRGGGRTARGTDTEPIAMAQSARVADADRLVLVVEEHAVDAEVGELVAELRLLDHAVPLRDGPPGVGQHPVTLGAPSDDQATVFQTPFGSLSGGQSLVLPYAHRQHHDTQRPFAGPVPVLNSSFGRPNLSVA